MPRRENPGTDPRVPLFTPALFQFLRELRDNNNREWFQEHKARFEADVKGPLLGFVMAFAEPLEGINRHFLADPRPVGGSVFRIYRDTRFSHAKEPYKQNVGAQFRHRAASKDVHAPGFYLHLEPGACFASAGLWRPDPVALLKVRERIAAHPRIWKALAGHGIEVAGEALKRVPAGFDPAHPCAEDLKLKDFYTHTALSEREICAPDFLERFTGLCRDSAPLAAFLSRALELPW